jgi:hypothetical protein
MWTLAHAGKAARAKQLPAWLSAKRTAAFGSGLRVRARRRSAAVLKTARDNFRDNLGDTTVPHNCGEVAERLKAAVC